MSGLLKFFREFLGPSQSFEKAILSVRASPAHPDLSRFAEGDRILIDSKRLSGPLRRNQKQDTPHGFLADNDIIGRPALRSQIKSNTGHVFEIKQPSLNEYVSLTPRKVTPVYASYASLIVSLLDIHTSPPPVTDATPTKPQIEILESGTGHGSLTLHLARAISGANPLPPALTSTPSSDLQNAWTAWRQTRRAVLNTVEVSPVFQRHAEKIVRGFRQGLYWPHVDFNTGSVAEWIQLQLKVRSGEEVEKGFLDHVILDMPGVHNQMVGVVPAMKEDALLVVFVPSVTQIGKCVQVIEENGLPLVMEKVVELGEGISNGRIWDVRLVKPRKSWPGDAATDVAATEKSFEEDQQAVAEEQDQSHPQSTDDDSVFVCRPMVGRMTFGGGFIGLWRKCDLVPEPTARRRDNKRSKQRSTSSGKKESKSDTS